MDVVMGWTAFGGVAVLAVGIAIGRWASGAARRARQLEAELAQTREEIARYREQVNQHFVKTAELLGVMTASYRAVYEHLAEGAKALCTEEVVELSPAALQSRLLAPVESDVATAASAERGRPGTAAPTRPHVASPEGRVSAPAAEPRAIGAFPAPAESATNRAAASVNATLATALAAVASETKPIGSSALASSPASVITPEATPVAPLDAMVDGSESLAGNQESAPPASPEPLVAPTVTTPIASTVTTPVASTAPNPITADPPAPAASIMPPTVASIRSVRSSSDVSGWRRGSMLRDKGFHLARENLTFPPAVSPVSASASRWAAAGNGNGKSSAMKPPTLVKSAPIEDAARAPHDGSPAEPPAPIRS